MKKLLWLSHNIPYPPKTGVLQRNYNLLREAARFCEIHLVAVFKEDILPGKYDLDEARRELGKLCKEIHVVRLPIESSRALLYGTALRSLITHDPLSVNWIKSAVLRETIRSVSQREKFDLVHFDTISLAAYRDDVSATARILNHHNIESQVFHRRIDVEKNPLKKFYYGVEANKLERYEREVCARFETNFTVSDLDGKRLQSIAPGARYDVVANGVDTDYFRPAETPVTPGNVVMISGMNWFPNRDAALYMHDRVWPLLSAKLSDCTWTVVGSSPPQQIVELAQRDPRVRVTGFVDDVRPYLAQAEVYLCPMRDGGGTRVKILDALAAGKAIVSTTMGLEGIDATPELNVLTADTPEAFVTQIERLRSDPALRTRIEGAARGLAMQTYSWTVIGDRLGAIYDELTKTGAART